MEDEGTWLKISLDGRMDDLDPAVPGGQITDLVLVKGATNEGKSIIVCNVLFDDGTKFRCWTTLALFYAASRTVAPQWESEVWMHGEDPTGDGG